MPIKDTRHLHDNGFNEAKAKHGTLMKYHAPPKDLWSTTEAFSPNETTHVLHLRQDEVMLVEAE